MNKKTTIYDIAQALNITVSTVSRALNGFPAISEATKKAVTETAKRLNYSPNKLASALKSGKTHTVGVIVPSVQAQFFASIIHCIEDVLKEYGYRVIIYQSNESVDNEINGVRTLLEAQVDGIIASMSLETVNVAHFEEIINQNKPLILFDRVHDALNVPTITLNDFEAGYAATQHLIEMGYKKIAFITTVHQIKIFNNRLKGYKAALADGQLPVLEEHIIYGGLSVVDGELGAEMLQMNNQPDAIVAGDDFTALGVVNKLKEAGKTPPEVGVIGFANEVFSEYITPNLSTIDQHPAQMGKECAKMFLNMIKQENFYQNVEHIVLNPTVIGRQSTRKI